MTIFFYLYFFFLIFVPVGIIEPPEGENIDTAIVRLQNVGALSTEQDLTPLGHHLALLPVDVRLVLAFIGKYENHI